MSCLQSLLVLACLVLAVQSASVLKRSTGEPKAIKERICPGRQPCGWYIYNKLTRIKEFFMTNTCNCPPDKICEQSDDDLSVGAYVFRCEEKTNVSSLTYPVS